MYGLINKSMREFVAVTYGADKWDKIIAEAGYGEESFMAVRNQPDETTYHLVGLASECCNLPAEELLQDFGKFWIHRVAADSYAALMEAHGDSLVEFLHSINAMHQEISGSFLSYRPPVFDVEQLADGKYRFVYRSHRLGLTAFVHGLLIGLSEHFSTPVAIAINRTDSSAAGEESAFELELVG